MFQNNNNNPHDDDDDADGDDDDDDIKGDYMGILYSNTGFYVLFVSKLSMLEDQLGPNYTPLLHPEPEAVKALNTKP